MLEKPSTRRGVRTVPLLVCVGFLVAAPAEAAPPPNDDQANATVIVALPFTDTVDATEATWEPGESPFPFGPGTVWYRFTPGTAVRVEASTAGSACVECTSISIVIGGGFSASFYDGGLGGCGSTGPRIVTDLAPGVTYYFQVWSSSGGHVVFNLLPPPAAPPNDDIDNASPIGALPFSDSVNTVSATRAADDPFVWSGGGTVWYAFTPSVDTVVSYRTSASDYPALVTILTGTRGDLTTLTGSLCFGQADLSGGVTYYFMVEAGDSFFFNAGGNLDFQLDGGPAPRAAVRVFGQPDFSTSTPNSGGLDAGSLSLPTGVAVDPTGEHLYVADRGNHRVLEYQDPTMGDAVADHVLGQPNFLTGTANNGGISARSLNFPTEVALDTKGNLYVADFNNNRALRYDSPLATDDVADLVLGQPDFATGTPNTGGRSAFTLAGPSGVATTLDGSLYVGEFNNSRAVLYDAPLFSSDAADLVLGEPDFTTAGTPGTSASSLRGVVTDVMLDAAGNLYVSDSSEGRVLEFSPPLVGNEPAANLVIGKPDFTTPRDAASCSSAVGADTLCDPRGLAVDCAGNLYVADVVNHRVLVYRDPLTTDTVADEVLGQFNFRQIAANWEGVSARTFNSPRGLAVDGAGNLYVADSNNSRVLMFAMFDGVDVDFDGLDGPQDACACEMPAQGLDADENGCTDTLGGLRAIVEGLAFDSNVENGLVAKLNEAEKAIGRGNTSAATRKLRDFIDQVEGRRGSAIGDEDADLLVAYASNLIELLS